MKSRNQRMSNLQEASVASDIGGKVQVASGATEFAKGDVRQRGELRVECKTTSKKSYALKVSEVMKIQEEALMGGFEEWAMQIQFQGQLGNSRKVAVVDWQTFLDLRDKAKSGDTK